MSDDERTRIRAGAEDDDEGQDGQGGEAPPSSQAASGDAASGDAASGEGDERTLIRTEDAGLEKTELMPPRPEDPDDRTEILTPDELPDAEEATRIRGAGDDADEDEATRIRSAGADADDDPAARIRAKLLGGTAPPAAATGAADVADEDEDEATRIRGGASTPADDGGADGEEEDEATRIRAAAPAAPALGGAEEEDEATRIRDVTTSDRTDATDVNPSTHEMPVSGRAALGRGDKTRVLSPAQGAGPAAADAASDDDATIPAVRPAGTADGQVSDDDATIQGGVQPVARPEIGDDDATLPGAGAGSAPRPPPGEDDPTLPAAARGGDEDATLPASGRSAATPVTRAGDGDPTLSGDISTAIPTKVGAGASTVGSGAVLRGRFALEDKLGEGGMGGVYKAKDLFQEGIERNPYVAIKVLNESFVEHPDAVTALQKEATKSQRLNHKNIAGVFGFDRDADTWFISMELLEGDPLDKVIKRNKDGLDRETAMDVIHDIAAGLAYAHTEFRLVHSDFKPGNIFYTKEGIAKVFDFGIARAATGEVVETTQQRGRKRKVDPAQFKDDGADKTIFDAGKLGALTPAYASREMFEGMDPAPQDDVYALGIVAYQCLTGKHPFNRKPAPQAEGLNMKAERPQGISNRQWKALQHALAFHRADRTPDASMFIEEFFGETSKWPWYMAAGFLLLAVGGYFAMPEQVNVPVPEAWSELEASIDNSERLVDEQLTQAATPDFEFSDGWADTTWANYRSWRDSARPTAVVAEFDNVEDAEALQKDLYQVSGVVTRVDLPAPGTDGVVRVVAGPFGGDPEAALEAMEVAIGGIEEAGQSVRVDNDGQDLAETQQRILEVYMAHAEAMTANTALPELTETGANGELTLSDEKLGLANRQTIAFEDLIASLDVAMQRYGAQSGLQAYKVQYEQVLNDWTAHIRSENEAETLRKNSGLLAAQEQAARARREAADTAARIAREQQAAEAQSLERQATEDRVMGVFAGQCDQTSAVSAALVEFSGLAADAQVRALEALNGCVQRRIGLATPAIERTKATVLASLGAAHADAAAALAAIEPPDPCSSSAYVRNGNVQPCMDRLADGSNGPPMVVVPAVNGGTQYGIGRYEVSVGEYNEFCAAAACGSQAPGSTRLPATGIPVAGARAYADWLSQQTGQSYRLPTLDEWRNAANADGAELDSNRNCYSSVRGVVKGERLVNATQGTANPWGLINHVGNAQEWTDNGGSLMAAGGKHTDPLASCTVMTQTPHDGSPDAATGFRLVREISR